ncbi:MAG: aminoacetone oxidase family FAD-binding enzyme [Clostridia bacterium]|nr:aminoacetone oxidase family FAD-binding enzyme [Clostridia bacterium]
MNKIYKAAIIGGGASGLLCAAELLSGENRLKGGDVVILERNDRVGKKLIATGNGQGNLTNAEISAENYSGDSAFIKTFIEQSKLVNLTEYFKNLGIITEKDESGRIYPVSRQANSVLDILRAYLIGNNCTIITGFKANKITERGGVFTVSAENGEKITAENVVLAVGGKAAKQFGTDGQAYALATAFNHKLTPLFPSLVQLKTEKEPIKGLKGIKLNATVALFDGNTFIKKASGDLLFTDYGVSGNTVFKISDKAATLKNPVLKIDFLPQFTDKELSEILAKRTRDGFMSKTDILNGLVHKKLGETIVKQSGGDLARTIKTVKSFTVKVTGTLGFDYAQTTKGGIDTADIHPHSYESKLQKGLYITGEMLDVDGECGGYNLTFAFISGIIAARSIKNKFKN